MRATLLFRIILAIGITSIATLIALQLAALRIEAPYIVFLFAVLGALLIGEAATSAAVVLLSAVGTWFFFIPPVWSFALPNWEYAVTLTLFVCVAAAATTLFYGQRRRIDELHQDNADLRQQLRRLGR